MIVLGKMAIHFPQLKTAEPHLKRTAVGNNESAKLLESRAFVALMRLSEESEFGGIPVTKN